MRRLIEEKSKVLVGTDSDYTERYWKPAMQAIPNSLHSSIIIIYRETSGYSFEHSRDRSVCYGQFRRSRFNDKED